MQVESVEVGKTALLRFTQLTRALSEEPVVRKELAGVAAQARPESARSV